MSTRSYAPCTRKPAAVPMRCPQNHSSPGIDFQLRAQQEKDYVQTSATRMIARTLRQMQSNSTRAVMHRWRSNAQCEHRATSAALATRQHTAWCQHLSAQLESWHEAMQARYPTTSSTVAGLIASYTRSLQAVEFSPVPALHGATISGFSIEAEHSEDGTIACRLIDEPGAFSNGLNEADFVAAAAATGFIIDIVSVTRPLLRKTTASELLLSVRFTCCSP